MSSFNRWQSGTVALMALSLTAGAVAPLVIPATAFAQTATFSDVHRTYALYKLNIICIDGFGHFRR